MKSDSTPFINRVKPITSRSLSKGKVEKMEKESLRKNFVA